MFLSEAARRTTSVSCDRPRRSEGIFRNASLRSSMESSDTRFSRITNSTSASSEPRSTRAEAQHGLGTERLCENRTNCWMNPRLGATARRNDLQWMYDDDNDHPNVSIRYAMTIVGDRLTAAQCTRTRPPQDLASSMNAMALPKCWHIGYVGTSRTALPRSSYTMPASA